MHAFIHSCMHTCMHACMNTYIHTYMHAYIHTDRQTGMHRYIDTCIHTIPHTYIRTYIFITGENVAMVRSAASTFVASPFGSSESIRMYCDQRKLNRRLNDWIFSG